MSTTSATEWPAHLVAANGNVMCGRQVGGRYVCQGPIGAVHRGAFYFLPGIIPDRERPGWWKLAERARGKIAVDGIMPRFRRSVKASASGEQVLVWKAPELPARYPCQQCKCTARIDSAVLSSEKR